jgi:hypothetical protein
MNFLRSSFSTHERYEDTRNQASSFFLSSTGLSFQLRSTCSEAVLGRIAAAAKLEPHVSIPGLCVVPSRKHPRQVLVTLLLKSPCICILRRSVFQSTWGRTQGGKGVGQIETTTERCTNHRRESKAISESIWSYEQEAEKEAQSTAVNTAALPSPYISTLVHSVPKATDMICS